MTTALPALALDDVVDPHRHPVLWLLLGFVVTALITRWVTRRIRARQTDPAPPLDPGEAGGLIKDIHIGGVHVHHQVWGILLVMVVGLLLVTYQPSGPWLNTLAALFGAGAALALDEFAMWLHLEDVYWATEGRKSISAMMTAAAICFVLILGSAPLGIESSTEVGGIDGYAIATTVIVNLVFVVIAILKGKLPSGLVGLFIPLVSVVAAIRLAKPDSWWAGRRYPSGSKKRERSQRRFGPAYVKRWQRIQDMIGGAPSTPSPDRSPAH